MAVACSGPPPIPNPGFRIRTVQIRRTTTGNIPIEAPAVGAVTSGRYREDLASSTGVYDTAGEVRNFQKTSLAGGYFDVVDGRASALWFFDAVTGWDLCNGSGTVGIVDRGREARINCETRIQLVAILLPNVIYLNESPVELQATVNGVNTNYGMPIFRFEDYTGKLIAETTATQVNGNTVKASSSCLSDKPVGTYAVKIYNGRSKHNPSNDPIGVSSIAIMNPPQDCWAYSEMRQECELNGGIWKGCRGCYSPIVIDVLGNGYNLTNGSNGIEFDLTGGGSKDKISWTSANSDDAWLVLDRNRNGEVDSGLELFGNFTTQDSSIPAKDKNGFLALAVFDKPNKGGNGDGVIDNRDAIFTSLQLWQDKNHNGKSEPNELSTLSSLDIAKLELDYRVSRRTDEHGNKFKYRAKVWDANKAKVGRWAWDVFLLKGE